MNLNSVKSGSIMADHPITRSPAELVEQWLHSRTNQQLATVLQARSDIAIPQPHDLHTLAHRLLLPASLARAIEQRNATELAILEALLATGAHTQPVSRKDVVRVLAGTQLENAHPDPPPRADASVEGNYAVDVDKQHSVTATNSTADLLSQTLQQLRDHALVFPYPATEKTPIAEGAEDAADTDVPQAPEDTEDNFLMWIPARVDKLLSHRDRLLYQESVPAGVVDKLPEKHREILRRIHAGGGLGTTKHARSDDPEHPITQMVNSGVLRAIDDSTVTLPVSVNRIVSGLPATDVHLLPSSRIYPELWDSDAAVAAHYLPARNPSESELSADSSNSAITAQETTDSGATATGLEACREISSLLDFLDTHPVPMLKNGGLGQRSTWSGPQPRSIAWSRWPMLPGSSARESHTPCLLRAKAITWPQPGAPMSGRKLICRRAGPCCYADGSIHYGRGGLCCQILVAPHNSAAQKLIRGCYIRNLATIAWRFIVG